MMQRIISLAEMRLKKWGKNEMEIIQLIGMQAAIKYLDASFGARINW